MSGELQTAAGLRARALARLKPPARMNLSDWADRHFVLSAESAAQPGPWKTLPYQKGIMDAITDPAIERVTFMKSARVGATKIMNAAIGFYMHQDPCPIMLVQPTVEDAEGYSKEEIAPMLRDCDVLRNLVGVMTRTSGSTILAKGFPGGSLTMVGANSARGFRRVSRRVVLFDEVDGYPPSAGSEGDQIKLGIRRTEHYWNRKIVAASTPTDETVSRIARMFRAGDQRRYHVPCPHCGHADYLVFSERKDGRGHFMRWPEHKPEHASFVCVSCGLEITEQHKVGMLEAGAWVGLTETKRHASFHVWAAYSMSPNARWGQIAREFVDAKHEGPEALKTVVNTLLGETWKARGDAPPWERLFHRREPYPIGTAPARVQFITAGVDVQKDRLVFEIVGWDLNKESWSIDAGILHGDPAADDVWTQLDDLLSRSISRDDGASMAIQLLAVDAGFLTQQVYNWCRQYPMSRVIACKGSHTKQSVLVSTPRAVDVTKGARTRRRAYKYFPVGVDLAKSELYGWLGLEPSESGRRGYCHFPEYDAEYFRQLTAEQLVTTRNRRGYQVREWQVIPGRENHWLDCRVYARAAASVLGLDKAGTGRATQAKPPAKSKAKEPSKFVRGRKGYWD